MTSIAEVREFHSELMTSDPLGTGKYGKVD